MREVDRLEGNQHFGMGDLFFTEDYLINHCLKKDICPLDLESLYICEKGKVIAKPSKALLENLACRWIGIWFDRKEQKNVARNNSK